MLKIHKLQKVDLVPGVEPPARLITALQEGVSKRSDTFLSKYFIQDLEKDFCLDLLKDTNGALHWLDEINNITMNKTKTSMKGFTFDYKSLYDSLKPSDVIE